MITKGVDVVGISRLKRAGANPRFLSRVFTGEELCYAFSKKAPFKHLAGRFAAKEAVMKALGTGLGSGLTWQDVEVLNDESGQPLLNLCRRAAEVLGESRISISIAYSSKLAFATALIEDKA